MYGSYRIPASDPEPVVGIPSPVVHIPSTGFPKTDHVYEFEEICKEGNVNAVNHGEFEDAADQIFAIAERVDRGGTIAVERCPVLAIQRCRRGGKTFMLHAVASLLSKRHEQTNHVILISLNGETRYMAGESPYTAILSRIAYNWERHLGFEGSFRQFRGRYTDFVAIDSWLYANKVLLLIDELNVLPPEGVGYSDMSHMLDELPGRKGSAVMYSTHHRSYADILRGRTENCQFRLSTRDHRFLLIPRVRNKDCLEGLQSNAAHEPSLWSAVLRGRIPCLILTSLTRIQEFADISFLREAESMSTGQISHEDLEERALDRRIQSLASAVTGNVVEWDGHVRDEFKAYSYMAERRGTDARFLYAWPPFLLASATVLGKDYRILSETLCSPQIDEAKAFEALSQLAVLLRLLSSQPHDLVPHGTANLHPRVAFEATEMYHASEEAKDLDGLIKKVTEMYALRPQVMQVVVVPLFASFPTYDFFLFHRNGSSWMPAAGYQCKLGDELPDEKHQALTNVVPLSVWIGGSCRKYRMETGTRVSQTEKYG